MSEKWPFFEQRFPVEELQSTVAYRDGLLIILLGLVLIGAIIYGYATRKQCESIYSAFITFALLQALFVSGVLATLLQAPSDATFWHTTLQHTLAISGGFVVSAVVTFWIWHTFSTAEKYQVWFRFYFNTTALLGGLLYVPLLLILLDPSSRSISLYLSIGLYLLFRLALFGYALRVFPRLFKYPLHIILYLCTCEFAPIVYLFHGLI